MKKTILFDGREYHCVDIHSEPWTHPEIGLRSPSLHARLPSLKFTPVRWRFVCREGVLVAVPLGFFDARQPERIPVEIRRRSNWDLESRPVSEDDRNYFLKLGVGMPPKDAKQIIRSEHLDVLNYLVLKLPGVDLALLEEIMEQMHFTALYDNGGRDYFVSVEVCEPTREEVSLIRREQSEDKTPEHGRAGLHREPYKIERRGADYEITFDGHAFTAPARIGMSYIVTYFRHENDECNPLLLYAEAHGSVPDRRPKDDTSSTLENVPSASTWNADRDAAARFVAKAKEKLKDKLRLEFQERTPDGLEDDQEKRLAALRKEIGDTTAFQKEIRRQARIADGRRFVSNDDSMRKREAMRRAIARTLRDIVKPHTISASVAACKAAKQFADHVRSYLIRDNMRYYAPPPGVSWILPG